MNSFEHYSIKYIEIYTDGACSNNQNRELSVGGWAYHLSYNGLKKIGKGQVKNTTNNRMEMTAIIEALRAIKKTDISVIVKTDSQLIVDTIQKGWKRNANIDLWHELDIQLNRFKDITFVKVKGHGNDTLNNLVDRLAVEMTKL
ncbi:MAG: ribonuclease H [Sulfolobaceae archaeon]